MPQLEENFNNYCEECKNCFNRMEYIGRQLQQSQAEYDIQE